MKNKRQYSRTKISFPLECDPLKKKRFASRKKYFYTVSKDLSLGGVKILTNKFLLSGDFLKLGINLIDQVITLKAKVIWCNKERLSDRYSAGLEFVEVNKTKRNTLSEFLNTIFYS